MAKKTSTRQRKSTGTRSGRKTATRRSAAGRTARGASAGMPRAPRKIAAWLESKEAKKPGFIREVMSALKGTATQYQPSAVDSH